MSHQQIVKGVQDVVSPLNVGNSVEAEKTNLSALDEIGSYNVMLF